MKIEIENLKEIDQQQLQISFFKIATFDIRVTYTPEKWELFRSLTLMQKDNKRWVGLPRFKREDKWVEYYERSGIKELLHHAQIMVEKELPSLAH